MLVDQYGREISTENYATTKLGDFDNEYTYVKQAKVIQYISTTSKDNKWENWGENNLYPQEVLFYAGKSPITDGIIQKEITRIVGGEVVIEGTDNPVDSSHPLFYTSPGIGIRDFIEKLAQDTGYLSTFAFSAEYSLNKKKITGLYYIPSKTIRSGKQNNRGQVNRYYVSNNWGYKQGYNAKKPRSIASYNPERQNELMSNAPQLYFFKNENPNDFYYSKITWESALNYTKLDYEVSNFHLSTIRNGLNPGLIISFPRTASNSEARKMKSRFKRDYQGTDNPGKLMFFHSANADALPQVEQLEVSNLDKQYQALNLIINEKVALATGCPRILTGLETSVGLSNGGGALLQAEQEWFKNEISKKRQWIVNAINEICDYSGYPRIGIESTAPNLLQFGLDDSTLKDNFTPDEIRQAISYQPIAGGDTLKTEKGEN